MPRGGARKGAGRPKGQGKYNEETKAIRIPQSLEHEVLSFIHHKAYKLPLFSSHVSAGFPSPADDYKAKDLDLNEHLIKHPAATFFLRVAGDSMIGSGIHDGDLLVVDRSLDVKFGAIVIASLDGQLTVKRLVEINGKRFLQAENPNYSPIEITEESDMKLWGVVTNVIHKL